MTRYTFIAFDYRAERFGVQRVRKLFIYLSIAIPLACAIIYDATTPIESTAALFSAFYGNLISSNGSNTTSNVKPKDVIMNIQSPIYYIVNSFFHDSIIRIIKIVGTFFVLVIHSNLIEALLYVHLLIIFKRY